MTDLTVRWLVLDLSAPLMSFGSVAVDHVGPTARWPGASMLTGLLANALGWDWNDRDAHQSLQDRLRFGAMETSPGDALLDTQNAQLGKTDRGWTTRGAPEGRTGDSYDSPHRRRRHYLADAAYAVVMTLDPPAPSPTLDDLVTALDRPARPLVIGRKPCLPSRRLLSGEVRGATAFEALSALRLGGTAVWPEGDGPDGTRSLDVADRRIWSSGLHGGTRVLVEGTL